MAEALRQQMHDYYMAWIDKPLPALNGRTPRQVCRTSAAVSRLPP